MPFVLFYLRWCATLALLLIVMGLGVRPLSAETAHHRGTLRTVHAFGSDPVDIYIEDIGRGPPIVMLHGMGGSSYSFRYIMPALARTHRVIVVDLKGFGYSAKPVDHGYTTRHQAFIVLRLLEELKLRDVTLVGHSFGGAVALKAAIIARHVGDHRISRLILMNVPAYPQPLARQHALMQMPVVPYLVLSIVPPILSARLMLETPRPRGPSPTDNDALAYARPLFDFAGKHALITTARQIAAANPNDVVPHYGALAQPTLLIWCRNDPTVPESSGHRLKAQMPRARMVVLDGCSHMPSEEVPGDTLMAIRNFLQVPQQRHGPQQRMR